MRLIDADNFKEDLLKLWDYNTVDGITATTVLKQVISDLDNAPTVPLPDFKEGYKQAIIDGKTNFSKPQGEWKPIDTFVVKCSVCGVESFATPFCPRCGADMRGAELYREETCKNKDSCDDYKYWHCVGCNGCKKGGVE